jgi:adenosylmethionine---8-amino-7-oxononanoate aminotransferase
MDIAAIDIVTESLSSRENRAECGYLNPVGMEIRHHAIEHGLFLRPLDNVLYLMQPYWIAAAELAWVYQQIDRVLAKVL